MCGSSSNTIKALKVSDVWVQSPLVVRKEVLYFFRNHVNSWERLEIYGAPFSRLSIEENNFLIRLFMLEEIESVVGFRWL